MRRLWADFGTASIPIVLGFSTLFLGVLGWTIYVLKGLPPNPTFHGWAVLHALAYIVLRTATDFFPSVWNINEGNTLTDAAAMTGAMTFYSSMGLIATNLMSETTRKVAARLAYADHVVIVGGTALATRVEKVWRETGRRTLQVVLCDGAPPPRGSVRVRSTMDAGLVERFSFRRAGHVLIDLGDDMATLSLAFDLLTKLVEKAAVREGGARSEWALSEWTVVVRDRVLADHFAQRIADLRTAAGDLPAIHYFCPERAIVRRFLAGHPLFLADRTAQNAPVHAPIHALVVGYGSAAADLIEAIYQTSFVADRDAPRVTVLSADPRADRSSFLSGRPTLAEAVDVEFVDIGAIDDFEAATTSAVLKLRARDAAAPVGAIFLMSSSSDENVRLAVKLKRVQRKTGRLKSDLFACDTSITTDADRPVAGAFGRTIDGFTMFGLTDAFIDIELCNADRRETLARALHARYLESTGATSPTWSELSESFRRANCNAADHCLAKLYSLGFDVSELPPGVVPYVNKRDVDDILQRPYRDAPLTGRLLDVVRLEHERWAVERRFDGWTYGERDKVRQTNPLLMPWDDLVKRHPEAVAGNREQVEALLDCLASDGDPLFTVARRPGAGLEAANDEPRRSVRQG